jgi:hypothetical protein
MIGTVSCTAFDGGATGQQRCLDRKRHTCHFRSDRVEQDFDPALRDMACNKDDPAAAIIGRPAFEPGWRMKDMLDAVNHRRPIGTLGNVHYALEAQEIVAAVLGEGFEKECQGDGPDRLCAHDRVGLDVGFMPGVRVSVGFPRQPGIDVKRLGPRS